MIALCLDGLFFFRKRGTAQQLADIFVGVLFYQSFHVTLKPYLVPVVFCRGVECVVAQPNEEAFVQELLEHPTIDDRFKVENLVIIELSTLGLDDSLT